MINFRELARNPIEAGTNASSHLNSHVGGLIASKVSHWSPLCFFSCEDQPHSHPHHSFRIRSVYLTWLTLYPSCSRLMTASGALYAGVPIFLGGTRPPAPVFAAWPRSINCREEDRGMMERGRIFDAQTQDEKQWSCSQRLTQADMARLRCKR